MKTILLALLTASNAFAMNPQTFICDMRDLKVNDITTGLYKLQISSTDAILFAGIWGDQQIATLSQESSTSKSSTLFVHKDEKGRIEQSFDLQSSGTSGILIWRSYGWEDPDSQIPSNISVHICNKK